MANLSLTISKSYVMHNISETGIIHLGFSYLKKKSVESKKVPDCYLVITIKKRIHGKTQSL